jgi:hypothetical protein
MEMASLRVGSGVDIGRKPHDGFIYQCSSGVACSLRFVVPNIFRKDFKKQVLRLRSALLRRMWHGAFSVEPRTDPTDAKA